MMILRDYHPKDCKEMANLFYQTVHSINRKDYSEEQLHAWATGKVDYDRWNASFLKHKTIVAEINGKIVGFGDMDETGYLDRLYVHKDFQGQNIASSICRKLEQSAKADTYITHASITAKPFFEKMGYEVVKEQEVERDGIKLKNYVMKKHHRRQEVVHYD
jgi:putative acetyltransferase